MEKTRQQTQPSPPAVYSTADHTRDRCSPDEGFGGVATSLLRYGGIPGVHSVGLEMPIVTMPGIVWRGMTGC